MLAKRPYVARLRDRISGRGGDGIGRIIRNRRAVVSVCQKGIQFIVGEPDQAEVEILGQQRLQFLQQQGLVPAPNSVSLLSAMR